MAGLAVSYTEPASVAGKWQAGVVCAISVSGEEEAYD